MVSKREPQALFLRVRQSVRGAIAYAVRERIRCLEDTGYAGGLPDSAAASRERIPSRMIATMRSRWTSPARRFRQVVGMLDAALAKMERLARTGRTECPRWSVPVR